MKMIDTAYGQMPEHQLVNYFYFAGKDRDGKDVYRSVSFTVSGGERAAEALELARERDQRTLTGRTAEMPSQANDESRAVNQTGDGRRDSVPTVGTETAGQCSTKRQHEARHRASGAAAAQCEKLRRFLRLHHPQNWTRKELSRRRDLGMDINVICARVDDIREELDFTHRSCSVTRHNVEALSLKAKQAELAA